MLRLLRRNEELKLSRGGDSLPPQRASLLASLSAAETHPGAADTTVVIEANSSCVRSEYLDRTLVTLVYLSKVLSPSCDCKRWSGSVPPDAGCGYAGTCISPNGTCFAATRGKCGDDKAATVCERPAIDVDDVAFIAGECKTYRNSLSLIYDALPSGCSVTVTISTDNGAI